MFHCLPKWHCPRWLFTWPNSAGAIIQVAIAQWDINRGLFPEWIIFCGNWPGLFSRVNIDRIAIFRGAYFPGEYWPGGYLHSLFLSVSILIQELETHFGLLALVVLLLPCLFGRYVNLLYKDSKRAEISENRESKLLTNLKFEHKCIMRNNDFSILLKLILCRLTYLMYMSNSIWSSCTRI